MKSIRPSAAAVLVAVFAAGWGCGVSGPPEVGLTTQPITRFADYRRLTGTRTLFISSFLFSRNMFLRTNYMLNDALEPVRGVGPNGPSILGSSLGGVSVDGEALAGRAVIGTELVALSRSGELQTIRIDDIQRSDHGTGDLLHYLVSARSSGPWQDLCGGGPAIALPGRWDLSEGAKGSGGWQDASGFFFACQGSTVEKCYSLGFQPWKFQTEGETVLNLHEACVRALRADYGGTGATGTNEGIDVLLSTDLDAELPSGFALEAAWSVDGARCRVRERVASRSADYAAVPPCSDTLLNERESLLFSFSRIGSQHEPGLATQDEVSTSSGRDFAYAGFEGTAGKLHGAGGGEGWQSQWSTQTGTGDMEAVSFSPMVYPGLKSTPQYVSAFPTYYSFGRHLDTEGSASPSSDPARGSDIVSPGEEVWVSVLLRRDASIYGDSVSFGLGETRKVQPWFRSPIRLSASVWNPTWRLTVPGADTIDTGTPFLDGETVLAVLRVAAVGPGTNVVELYLNPDRLGSEPPTVPTLTVSTAETLRVGRVRASLRGALGRVGLDEIRVGSSYAAVTPTAP
ncbi:MAG: ADYC domain-containing protein [Myxococcota bacterium]